MTGPLRQTARGLLLDVKVTPKASHNSIAGLAPLPDGAQALAVKVTAPPDKGKANKAVHTLIAEEAGLPKSALVLVSGDTDRHKVFSVTSHAETLSAWLLDVGRK